MFAAVAKRLGVLVVLWLHAAFNGRTWLERWALKTKPDALIFKSEFSRDNSLRSRGPQRAYELCDPVAQLDKFCSFFEGVAKIGKGEGLNT